VARAARLACALVPRLLPVLAAAAVALLAPAVASATTETAALGAVSATFSYEKVGDFEYQGLDLHVTRGGVPAFDGVADAPDCVKPYCAPLASVDEQSLRVADVDADGEPEVLVDLYTGGAHCCVVTEVLWWNGTQYVASTRNFADFGYTLADGVFTSGDARFGYEFSSFADSAMPVRLLTFRHGAWTDVTRSHPEALRADAARWLKAYKKRRDGRRALGLLAAYIADEHRLGEHAKANAFLRSELRAHRLRSDRPWPGGEAYISLLNKRLRAWGYARS
jgi:hypothetical protein